MAGTMEGSFLAPDMHMSWEAPEAAASGSVDLSRDSNSFTCRAPAVDVSAALLLKPAPIDAVKTVLTQVPCLAGKSTTCLTQMLDVPASCDRVDAWVGSCNMPWSDLMMLNSCAPGRQMPGVAQAVVGDAGRGHCSGAASD